jgi:hypothetical protein
MSISRSIVGRRALVSAADFDLAGLNPHLTTAQAVESIT